ncbi:uncharacterized protein K460DRAFT_350547 [Cucurbitaria berberidis CBS 394.84]|uniref:Uncharacterized protein n=1 Tax=Cucurbitaria berberidis CBS 394.84 TaxID=1168544 RepID=A0A9P4LC99_9PLEO|nr:uncharacterized protein K460DRAFT_350547 [Cucurbitaria berberidis CBS 394.84]KAF1850491.1 hypothetical protein K460DRAFT_350547 [Cucurbitaria berberidis CBS 394.84]
MRTPVTIWEGARLANESTILVASVVNAGWILRFEGSWEVRGWYNKLALWPSAVLSHHQANRYASHYIDIVLEYTSHIAVAIYYTSRLEPSHLKIQNDTTTFNPTRDTTHHIQHVLIKSSQHEPTLRKGRHVDKIHFNNGLYKSASSICVPIKAV